MITLTLEFLPNKKIRTWKFSGIHSANAFFLAKLRPIIEQYYELIWSNERGAEWGDITYDADGNEMEDLTEVFYKLTVAEA